MAVNKAEIITNATFLLNRKMKEIELEYKEKPITGISMSLTFCLLALPMNGVRLSWYSYQSCLWSAALDLLNSISCLNMMPIS